MKTQDQKRSEAQARQAAYDTLTNEQKLILLDKAFGPGKGAARERARLTKRKEPVVVAELADGSAQLLTPEGTLKVVKAKFKKGQSHRSVEKKS